MVEFLGMKLHELRLLRLANRSKTAKIYFTVNTTCAKSFGYTVVFHVEFHSARLRSKKFPYLANDMVCIKTYNTCLATLYSHW